MEMKTTKPERDWGKVDWHKLSIPEGQAGDYKLRHIVKPAGARLETSTLRTALFGQPRSILCFDYETVWHELSYSGGVWMTDLPVEQAQHMRELEAVYGRVLVGGLGLGCGLNMLRDNPDVTHVTVVEKNIEVIDLVWAHLKLPNNRFTIVNQDLFYFLRTHNQYGHGPVYDYCFYDIWQSDGEMTFHDVVVPLRELTEQSDICNDNSVICWNEDVMRAQLLNGLMTSYHLLSNRLPGAPMTVEMLTSKLESAYFSIFPDWAIQFWKGYRDIPEGEFEKYAAEYARCYARGIDWIDDHWSYIMEYGLGD